MVNGSLTGPALTSAHVCDVPGDRAGGTMIESTNGPNPNRLVELANRDGVDIRPTLLRVMTDLYVQKPMHSVEEERHFTELALRLIDLVDAETRFSVADRLGRYPNAPAAVRQRLLRDQIKVDAHPQPATSAAAPDTRSKTTAAELSELFHSASADERRLILLNLPYAPLRPAAPIPAAMARESTHRLEAAALGHNSEVFAREIERTFIISRAQARSLIDDSSGEPIVVLAVALGMPAAVLQRILLCLNPAISQSVQRVYELALLHEETEPEAALRLVAIWQASHRAEKKSVATHPAAHQPVHSPAESRERVELAARPKIRWDEYQQVRKSDSA
jgi:hypothetical protein